MIWTEILEIGKTDLDFSENNVGLKALNPLFGTFFATFLPTSIMEQVRFISFLCKISHLYNEQSI